jgi:Tfp pilus assembly protein PilN
MRAVNLIPADQRRGAGGLAGRSGGVVYVLTGGLAVLVILGVVYALAVHKVADKNGQLATLTQQVSAVQGQAQSLAPYVEVAGVSAEKVTEVNTLAKARFNWPGAMRQLALALPSDVTLTSFGATADGGVANAAGVTGTDFSLAGCANSQAEVATVLTSLAAVPGVTAVTLTNATEDAKMAKHYSSRKAEESAAESAGGGCPFTTWNLTVSYDGSYTVPDVKAPPATPAGAQTVGSKTPAPVIKTAAKQKSTGVSK